MTNAQAGGGLGRFDTAINVATKCRKCGADLEIDEIHYYDNGDGTATCNRCEAEWSASIAEWLSGEDGD